MQPWEFKFAYYMKVNVQHNLHLHNTNTREQHQQAAAGEAFIHYREEEIIHILGEGEIKLSTLNPAMLTYTAFSS